MGFKAYLITYKEVKRKRSVVIARGRPEAGRKFEREQDTKGETLEGERVIESIRLFGKEKRNVK